VSSVCIAFVGAVVGALTLLVIQWWTSREARAVEAWADEHDICAECGRPHEDVAAHDEEDLKCEACGRRRQWMHRPHQGECTPCDDCSRCTGGL
jgi:DNA-directed RNA polymerase subunit RPC12/RpoP